MIQHGKIRPAFLCRSPYCRSKSVVLNLLIFKASLYLSAQKCLSRHEIVGCGTDAVVPLHFVGESAHIDLVQGRNELRLSELLWAHWNCSATVDYSAESLPFELVLD